MAPSNPQCKLNNQFSEISEKIVWYKVIQRLALQEAVFYQCCHQTVRQEKKNSPCTCIFRDKEYFTLMESILHVPI